jgi:DNA-binding response OmpR family regulator
VDTAADGIRGLSMAQKGNYDLLILDLMLPKLDGVHIGIHGIGDLDPATY